MKVLDEGWASTLMKENHNSLLVILGDPFFHSDEQPELNLENDYPNKTGPNLKTNSSISILQKYRIVHNLLNQTVCKD